MSRIQILKSGLMTTVQDLGRTGYQQHGVSPGGVMDRQAARIANLLVGNSEAAALLELTLIGPVLRFTEDTLISVCGASIAGLRAWEPVRIDAGETVSLEKVSPGCRAYLAVAGGVEVAPVMGSASTYLRANLGGFEGRSLRAGDVLQTGASHPIAWSTTWHIAPELIPLYSSSPEVRIVRGPQWPWFGDSARRDLLGEKFRVTPKSDRMGLRLDGPSLALVERREMTSEPVTFGSIQIPPDGQPIVLMADRQTIGGYPKIAAVISVDLPLLAQLRPGDRVSFKEVSLAEAQAVYLANERALAIFKEGLARIILPAS